MTRRRRAEARRWKREMREMSAYPLRKVANPEPGLRGRASGADSADTEDADGVACAGLLRRSEGRILHGASYPGDESLRRSYPGDEDVGILKKSQGGNENFLSRKKWAMPGARYPGIELAAQKSVTRRSDDCRSQRTRRRRRTAVRRRQQGQRTNTIHQR